MMKKICLLIVALCLLLPSAIVLAQNEENPEDIFRWFPKAEYEEINYYNLAAMKAQKGWPLYKELYLAFGDRYQYISKLPDSIYNSVDSFVSGGIVTTIKVKKNAKVEEGKFPNFGKAPSKGVSFMVPINGFYYHFSGTSKEIFVFRITDQAGVLKEALASGDIVKSGESIDDKEVYQYKYIPEEGERSEYYLIATDFGELLMADTLKTLSWMQATGTGEKPGLLEDQDHHLLIESFESFTPSWEMTNFNVGQKAVLKKMLELGVSKKEIGEKEKSYRESSIFYVGGVDLTKAISMKFYDIYGSTAEAEKGLESKKDSLSSDSTLSREGNLVTINDPFSKEEIARFREYIAEKKEKLKAKQKSQK